MEKENNGRMALSQKHQAFVDRYLICFNATEAYMDVYTPKNRNVAAVNGTRLLRNAKISAEISKRLKEKAMTADELLARTADIARGNLADYIYDDGEINIKKLKEDGKGHLLKKYKRTRRTIRQKSGDEIEIESMEAEFYAADSAHDKLMRYHSLYNDKVKVEGWQDEVIKLLRTGEIKPEDVKLAYPELAESFFAKAGINASNRS